MSRNQLFALASLPFLAAPAFAQDHTSASHACQYNGDGFSIGSTIAVGKGLHRCEWVESLALPGWKPVNREETLPDGRANDPQNTEASANCLYASAFYGNGSLLVVRDQTLTCSQGIWFKVQE